MVTNWALIYFSFLFFFVIHVLAKSLSMSCQVYTSTYPFLKPYEIIIITLSYFFLFIAHHIVQRRRHFFLQEARNHMWGTKRGYRFRLVLIQGCFGFFFWLCFILIQFKIGLNLRTFFGFCFFLLCIILFSWRFMQ